MFRLLPESADILLAARLAMLPLGFASIALAGILGWQVAGRKGGAWAAVLASVCPPFVLKTVEFRNDTLWLVLLLAVILLILREQWFLAGLLLGVALMVSIKTAPFAVAIAIAFLVTRYGSLAPLIAGSAVVPAIVVAFFAFHGAAGEMFRWSVFANGTMAVGAGRRIAGITIGFAVGAASCWLAYRSSRNKPVVVNLIAILYISVFVMISPLIGPRDFLPSYPVGFIAVFVLLGPWTRHAAACMLVLLAVTDMRLWEPGLRYYPQIIADTIRFSSPDDAVFDQKGEMVFRHRATYIALESVSRKALAAGMLPDTIAADMVKSRAYVAVRDSTRIPPASRRFLNRYFVPFGSIRVAGQSVHDGAFEIAIPGLYTIVRNGAVVVPSRRYEAGRYGAPAGAVALWSGVIGKAADLNLELQRPALPAE